MFIVFDGIDGAGKSTQIQLIADWLRSINFNFLQMREPGGCEVAEKIRDVFVSNEMTSMSQLLLLSAARFENMQMIKDEQRLIICDRFVDSTYAYQGMCLSEEVLDFVVGHTVVRWPDYVFLFLNKFVEKDDNYLDQITSLKGSVLIDRYKNRIKDNYFVVPFGSVEEQFLFIQEKFCKILKIC